MDSASICNEHLRVEVRQADGLHWLAFQVRDEADNWMDVAVTGAMVPVSIWQPELRAVSESPEVVRAPEDGTDFQRDAGGWDNAEAEGDELVLTRSAATPANAGPLIETRIRLEGEFGVHVRTRIRIAAAIRVARCMHHVWLAPGGRLARFCEPLDFAWLPNLHRSEDHICSDHFFRAPAAIAVARGCHAALLPDLALMEAEAPVPLALDLRIEGTGLEAPRLSFGFCASEPDGHVYFRSSPDLAPVLENRVLTCGFRLWFGQGETPGQVVDRIVQWQWRGYGHPLLGEPEPQVLPFRQYGTRYVFRHELPASIRRVERRGAECAGIDNPHRRGAQFHAWENDLHIGYGLKHYAESLDNGMLEETSRGILNLFMDAPRTEGAFPCIFNFADGVWEGSLFWTARSADWRRGFDTAAMSVSAWWLLQWIRDFPDLEREPLLSLLTAYCDFLVANQLESGAVPTYFDTDLNPVPPLLESATTAISGAVLASAANLLLNPLYTRAAMRAGYFIAEHALPRLRFDDFEVFYSCSPKPVGAVDYWSGLIPHNNLSIQWACDMYLELWQRTREELWLEHGAHLLNILSLYQQVWNPVHLPGHLFGGFGVMNTDGEWNDGRQARFVSTYGAWYLATGRTEYLERAVAACRASFALMDIRENHLNGINTVEMPDHGLHRGYAPENIHHNGRDTGYGWSGMNWSAAGGLAAGAWLERHLGSVFLDVSRRMAHGIDGMRAEVLSWTEGRVELALASSLRDLKHPHNGPREVVLRAGGWQWMDEDPDDLELVVNGEDLGIVEAELLQAGLALTLDG